MSNPLDPDIVILGRNTRIKTAALQLEVRAPVSDFQYDVFLSHAPEDDELAALVADLLLQSDIPVFTTRPGFPKGIWSDQIRILLEKSEHFGLLLTENALERSVYVHHEFGYFYGYHLSDNLPTDRAAIIAW